MPCVEIRAKKAGWALKVDWYLQITEFEVHAMAEAAIGLIEGLIWWGLASGRYDGLDAELLDFLACISVGLL